jgi:hypothetical protein
MVARVAELQRASDDVRVGAEPATPEFVREHDGCGWIRGSEPPSRVGADAEYLEEVSGHLAGLDPLRGVIVAKHGGGRPVGGEALEEILVGPEVFDVRHAEDVVLGPGLRVGRHQRHQPLRVDIREGPQHHRVDDAEHRDVGADAQCQCHDAHGGKARSPRERPHGEAQILPDALDRQHPHVADRLLRLFEAAQIAQSGSSRLARRQALFDVRVGFHRQMELELRLHLACDSPSLPERAQTRQHRIPHRPVLPRGDQVPCNRRRMASENCRQSAASTSRCLRPAVVSR